MAGSSKFAIFSPHIKEVGFIPLTTMLKILASPQMDENGETCPLLSIEAEILRPGNIIRPVNVNKAFADFAKLDPEGWPLFIPFSRSPKAQWVNTISGSGALVFAIMDDSKCSLLRPFLRKQIWLYGKSYSVTSYFAPITVLQCMKCNK